jgi:hypothetical protein
MSVNEAAASMTSREMKDHLDVVDRTSREVAISQITLEHFNPIATAIKFSVFRSTGHHNSTVAPRLTRRSTG